MKIFMQFSIAFAMLLIGALPATAQNLSKEEARQWKQIAKDYKRNPAALKALTEERDSYQEEASELQQRISNLEAELMQAKRRNADLENQVTQVNNALMAARQENQELRQQQLQAQQPPASVDVSNSTGDDMTMGTVFRIQVGAFKRGGVPAKFNQYPDLYLEDDGGLQKVMIGAYRNHSDAKFRLSQLKGEGYSSAWIVAYKNGQRVSMDEALAN